MNTLLSRRQLLRSASLAALAAFLPLPLRGVEDWLRQVRVDRALVILELEGGNDGLNTIVPFGIDAYNTARPTLKLTTSSTDTRRQVLSFDNFSGGSSLPKPSGFGVHAKLESLRDVWQTGDLAIVQGVGYPNPNRSHFRGIDIWNNAATDDASSIPNVGWLGRMFVPETVNPNATINGIHFKRANNSPLYGAGMRGLSMSKPTEFLDRTDDMVDPSDVQLANAAANSGLTHVLKTQRIARRARTVLDAAVRKPDPSDATKLIDKITFATEFPDNDLGRQAKYIAQCIAGGLECPFYKMSIGGFDNHTEQANKHADLLEQVAKALAALRGALLEGDGSNWNKTLIMTNSEFGRRLEENDSQGTDHGAAAPHFMLGGGVNGGLYGAYPSLTALDDRGDLEHAIDFRQMYASCGTWLGVSPTNIAAALPKLLITDPDFVPVPGLLA